MKGAEVELYAPVKAFLEGQGYVVKGEVRGCDVVGVRGEEPPVVVELKRAFGLDVVLQGIDRLSLTDAVYLAVGAWPRRPDDARKLCRRLGLGLIVVARGRVEVVLDPLPYAPRRNRARATALLGEHARRREDPAARRLWLVRAARPRHLCAVGGRACGAGALRARRLSRAGVA